MQDDRDLRALVEDLQARVAALEQRSIAPPAQSARESSLGLAAVNRIGAITLAVGIIFFFKYAADNEWIGPAGRVAFGLGLGAILIGASEWFRKREQQTFSQGLAGCGLATLYTSIYAAFGFYHLIGSVTALLCLLALCGTVLLLSVRRQSPAIAALGLAGALLTPQFIELAEPKTWAIVQAVYLFAIDLTALAIGRVLESRVLVLLTASMVTITALLRVNFAGHGYPFAALMVALSFLHFATWFAKSSRSDTMYSVYITGHCFAATAGVRLIASWAPHTTVASTLTSIFLGVYGVALLSLGLAKSARTDRGLGLALLGLVIGKLYLYDIWNLAYAARITAFVALGVLLLLASFLYGRIKAKA